MQAAAAYFSALKPRANIRVVETDSVPKTFVAGMVSSPPAIPVSKEPIGQRIIEVPEDLEQFENRDPRSQFIAYVPIGSIAKGAALVSTGGAGKTLQCAICHGQDLKGLGGIPSIAGRSPSYIVRQLYDIQNGARAGTASATHERPGGQSDRGGHGVDCRVLGFTHSVRGDAKAERDQQGVGRFEVGTNNRGRVALSHRVMDAPRAQVVAREAQHWRAGRTATRQKKLRENLASQGVESP